MSKTIDTLVEDIQQLFTQTASGNSTILTEDIMAKFGAQTALAVSRSLRGRTGERKPNTLYMSEIGKPCKRQIWYGVHRPDVSEPLQGHTKYKFLYGDLIEETTLLLAEAAGHKVEHRQAPVVLSHDGWTISGRIDAVVDDVLVDVKSCSPFGYKKFEQGLDENNDSFGYRHQLYGYLHAMKNTWADPPKQAGFVAIDKQNGHVGFFECKAPAYLETDIEEIVSIVNDAKKEPLRKFALVKDGASGNEKLCTECSYCPFKRHCWRGANKGAGLRTFLYSNGPVFLGTVKRTPSVPEIDPILTFTMPEAALSSKVLVPFTPAITSYNTSSDYAVIK